MTDFEYIVTLRETPAAAASRLSLLCVYSNGTHDRGRLEAQTIQRHLVSEGARVGVLALPSLRPDSSEYPSLKSVMQPPLWVPSVLAKLSREIGRYDCVLLLSGSTPSSIASIIPGILIARFLGKRIVLGFGLVESEKYLSRWRNMLNPIFRMADQIVVNSRYTSAVFSRYGLPAKTVFMPVDLDQLPKRHITSVQPRLLVDRPLESLYNLPAVLEAFRLVKQKYPRAELLIAGRGSERKRLEEAIRSLKLAGVSLVTPADRTAQLALYGEADLFVNASLLDDTPQCIIEAMASGLPVVTTDTGGIPYLIKDRVSGLLAPVNDHVALADRIIELVENPSLVSQLSSQGRSEAGRFAWSSTRHAWMAALQPIRKSQ